MSRVYYLNAGANAPSALYPGDPIVWPDLASEAFATERRAAPNRLAGAPGDNILLFNTGEIRNEGGGPTLTQNYSGTGCRVQFTAAQTLSLYSASAVDLPAGQYTLSVKARLTGATPTKIRIGQSGAYTTVTLTGADTKYSGTFTFNGANAIVLTTLNVNIATNGASRAANVSTFTTSSAHGYSVGESILVSGVGNATFNGTFTVVSVPTSTTFTVANAGADEVSTGGSTALLADFIIDELQLYAGASTPAWAGAGHGGHLTGQWNANAGFELDGPLLDNTGGDGGRATLMLPAFPSHTAFTGITVMIAAETLANANDSPIIAPIYEPSPLINSATFFIGVEDTGEIMVQPTQSTTRESGFWNAVAGELQVYTLRLGASGRELWVNEMPAMISTAGAWGGMSILGFWLNAYASSRVAGATTFTHNGKVAPPVIWDRELTDDELKASVAIYRRSLQAQGAVFGTVQDVLITPGDSLTAWRSVPAWPWVLAADATIAPRVQLRNCANGGSGFGAGGSTNDYFENVLTREVIPAIAGAVAMGAVPIVAFMDGANNYAAIASNWQAYRDTHYLPYIAAIRAAHPSVRIIGIDTLPRGDAAATGVNFDASRVLWNGWKRAQTTGDGGYFDAYASFSGGTLDTFAGADAAGYYSADDLHLSATGQAYLAAIVKPALAAVRAL